MMYVGRGSIFFGRNELCWRQKSLLHNVGDQGAKHWHQVLPRVPRNVCENQRFQGVAVT